MARSPVRQSTVRARIGRAVPHSVLTLASILVVVPYAWAVFESFKSSAEADSSNILPHMWTLDNYGAAITFSYPPFSFAPDYGHSILVAASVTVAAIVTSTFVGFVLARYRFRGKETLFVLLILTFMIPFSVIVIPLYITIVNLGFNNSLNGLIITGLWSPLGILLMRQFMEGIPNELLEAGRIDGASELRLVLQMIVPLSTSAIGVLAIYTFMHSWDDFLWPSTVLHDPAQWTLPLLATYFRNNSFPTPFVMAVAMLTIFPVFIIYAFVARFFIRSVGNIALHV